MRQTWRLIYSENGSASYNMALDEALLQAFITSNSKPVLRFYGWAPAALSIGRFQNAANTVFMEKCRTDSVALVRRITGGGAIYHGEELTYSIVCRAEDIAINSSTKDTYKQLTSFLFNWYKDKSLEPDYAENILPTAQLGEKTAYCFAGNEKLDIIVSGKKLGGNAQHRKKNIIFQHGSIPLKNLAATGLEYMLYQNIPITLKTTSLNEWGISLSPKEIAEELTESFCCQCKSKLMASELTEHESEIASFLMTTKYSWDRWNIEGKTA